MFGGVGQLGARIQSATMSRSAAFVVAAVLFVSACTSPDSPDTTALPGSAQSPASAAPGEATVTTETEAGSEPESESDTTDSSMAAVGTSIVVVVDEIRAVALATTAARFTKNTGVEVVFDVHPRSEILRVASEPVVDIFMGPHLWSRELISTDEIVAIDGLDPTDWSAPAARAFSGLGGMVAVPFSAESLLLFRNTTLLAEAPGDLGTACPEPVDRCMVMPGLGTAGGYHLTPFLMAGASAPLDEQVANFGGPGAAVDALGRLVADGTVELASITAARRAFTSGEAALFLGGPWDLGPIEDSAISFAVGRLPAAGGVALSAPVSVQGFYLAAGAPQSQAATMFLVGYIAQAQAQRELYLRDRRAPVHRDLIDTLGPHATAMAEAVAAGFVLPPINLQIYWEELGEALQEIAAGADPVAAVQAAASRIDQRVNG